MLRNALFKRCLHLSTSRYKTIPTNLKGKSKSSQEWLTRHLNDPLVKKARELNLRARSAFKLIEIDDRFKLLRKGSIVVECGAAPGAWSQVIVGRINSDFRYPEHSKGILIGIDLLPIAPLPGAIFLENSDFTDPDVQHKVRKTLNFELSKRIQEQQPSDTNSLENSDGPVLDLVLSDLAPNASGIPGLDSSKLCSLVTACLKFAVSYGKPQSGFVAKVWEGSDVKTLEMNIKAHYKKVNRMKPESSRENSAEIYLIGQGKK